MLISRAI
jgi:cleavage and polyadenylation specificity factor subunit 1